MPEIIEEDKTKVKDWRYSKAKELLYKDIVSGEVNEDTEAEIVYGMKLEYQQYPLKNFKTNLRNLINVIRKHEYRSSRDTAILMHNLKLKPPSTVLLWNGSDAQKLLIEDHKNGWTEDGRTPKELHATRPEYQEFTLNKFRKHLTQVRRAKKARTYWMYLKKDESDDNDEDNMDI
jgi:hypothetical protein